MTRAQTTTSPDEAEQAAALIRAQQAAARLAPYAATAAGNARRGVYSARTWTAPRLEQTGVLLQEQVAPWVAAVLNSAAQQIRPIPPTPPKRRRWPLVTVGFITAAGLGAAAYLGNRRRNGLAEAPDGADSAAAPSEPTIDAAGSNVDGRMDAS
jgi:hypothetical protein